MFNQKRKINIGSQKFSVIAVRILIVIFIFFGFIFILPSFSMMPTGIFTLLIGSICLFVAYRLKKCIKLQSCVDDDSLLEKGKINLAEDTQENKEVEEQIDESKKNYNLFEDIIKDNNSIEQALCYEYENNICIIDYDIKNISGNGGEEIKFVQEPENQYDNKAVAIYLKENRIGYVYKGQIQDMINDWFKKGLTVFGYINKIFVNDNKVTFKIGFYKPLDSFENRIFSLIKTKKKIDEYTKREDNLSCCNEKESVSIECEYDYDRGVDTCVVYSDMYEEIGELGNGALKFIEENSSKKIVGQIDEMAYDDNDSTKAKIKVFVI